MRFIDITGLRVGHLTVLSRGPTVGQGIKWLCLCDCGRQHLVDGRHLRGAVVKSCGCERAEDARERFSKHGQADTPVYRVWQNMRNRCERPNNTAYKNYGGRGITVCERWRSFESFFADMGQPPPKHTLERRENDKGYYPDNCYWATRDTQGANKRNNRSLTAGGLTLHLAEWERRVGGSGTVSARLKRGWDIERACLTPRQTKE
jgi:hypothetical protein